MYSHNDFLDKSLEIIRNNRIKSNSIKNYFIKNIMNNEYVSQFLGYLSELEYDLETLNNYISDFQLLNHNMMINLEESSFKEGNYQNEIAKLKEALTRANEEIYNLRNKNNFMNKITKENNIKNKIFIDESEKNFEDSDSKFNYFRNYLNSMPLNTFRKTSKHNFQNLIGDMNNYSNRRFTYYRKENDNKLKEIDNNKNKNKKNSNIKTFSKKNHKLNNNKYKNNNIRKCQSLNNTKKIIRNENNNSNGNEINKIKNKSYNNKTFSKKFERYKNASDSNKINNITKKIPNNADIKEYLSERTPNSTNNNISTHNSLLNFDYSTNNITNNRSQNLIGKIIKNSNNTITSPISSYTNKINYDQYSYPANYSICNYSGKDSAVVLSKRMQNYIHNQNLKRRFDEISKDSFDLRKKRINNIIETILGNKEKLNELKLMFGNNIEAQILNGDLNDAYLNKIENLLYYMEKSKSIIPLSKRFQIQNNSSKKKKVLNMDENNTKTGRFLRKRLANKNYNKNNIKRWNTTKNFFENKNKSKV